MTQTPLSMQQTLKSLPPFDHLPEAALKQLLQSAQPLRYRVGQPILRREVLTQQVVLILEGQARLLGYDPRNQQPLTLKRLARGEIIGVISLIRGMPCETVIASTEVLALTLPSYTFLQLLDDYAEFGRAIRDRIYLIEAFDLISQQSQDQAMDAGDLKAKAQRVCDESAIVTLPNGVSALNQLDPSLTWVLSGGTMLNVPVGTTLPTNQGIKTVEVISPHGARLLGLTPTVLAETLNLPQGEVVEHKPVEVLDANGIPYATEDQLTAISQTTSRDSKADIRARNYAFARGRGEVEGALACFDMLSQTFHMPFRRDVIRRILSNQHERMGHLSLSVCGAIGEMMGLRSQLVRVPVGAFPRLNTPCLIRWQESFAVLYETSEKAYILGDPEVGIIRRTPESFEEAWGD
jgi:CRP-like cAMP-binding protein